MKELIETYLSGRPHSSVVRAINAASTSEKKRLIKDRIALELYVRSLVAKTRGYSEKQAISSAFTQRDLLPKSLRYRILHGARLALIKKSQVDLSILARDRVATWDDLTSSGLTLFAAGAIQSDIPNKEQLWDFGSSNLQPNVEDRLYTGRGVVIGVLDTGVDSSHPELLGKIAAFSAFDRSGKVIGTTPFDNSFHGTHVCGLLVGTHVGYAPNATVVVASVLSPSADSGNANEGTYDQIAAGMDWLMTGEFGRGGGKLNGVDIINASLDASSDNEVYSILFDQALKKQGILSVAAIGNANPSITPRSPGDYPGVIGVGACTEPPGNEMPAAFSCYGLVNGINKPDICAPGAEVWSCIPGCQYRSLSGTSMAAPCVTGAAALILGQYPELLRKPVDLKTAVLARARAWEYLDQCKNGVLWL